MGIVAMGDGGSIKVDGSTTTIIAYCLYCDKCGSFNIGKRITGKMIIWILISVIISTLFWYSVKDGALPGAWLVCFGSVVLIISFTGVFTRELRCNKCGNRQFFKNNILNYQDYDRSVLDVPYEITIKYFYDEY
jgi:predicted nucleic-acid-binding Zn-ribbon protein